MADTSSTAPPGGSTGGIPVAIVGVGTETGAALGGAGGVNGGASQILFRLQEIGQGVARLENEQKETRTELGQIRTDVSSIKERLTIVETTMKVSGEFDKSSKGRFDAWSAILIAAVVAFVLAIVGHIWK